MHLSTNIRRMTAAVLLGSFALSAMAPAAEAGQRGHGRKWKRVHTVTHVHHTSDCHDGLPAFAGFVGGLIVGAAVSNAYAAPPPPPRYFYYDPYCNVRWTSIDACTPHFRACSHPRTVRVVDVRSGHSVERWTWYHGRWHDSHGYDHDD